MFYHKRISEIELWPKVMPHGEGTAPPELWRALASHWTTLLQLSLIVALLLHRNLPVKSLLRLNVECLKRRLLTEHSGAERACDGSRGLGTCFASNSPIERFANYVIIFIALSQAVRGLDVLVWDILLILRKHDSFTERPEFDRVVVLLQTVNGVETLTFLGLARRLHGLHLSSFTR